MQRAAAPFATKVQSADVSESIRAILGPTNTGKTHAAVERMLAHRTGMIGLPLRLLAREVYDRVAARVGPTRVALVTGEEKIVPPQPQYWVATVEAMPVGTPVDFLAVDEIQLAADRQRGHVFTARLLHARGTKETMFLGSDSVASVLRRLLPDIAIERRSRFSTLRHVAPERLKRLPRRSAVVAFSAEEVYALAEILRRHRGGAAVVLGALSPRTRNAQAEMFESGEVDFLVATDAIGMGLNMNIAHVAFASLHKFDGERERPLSAAEIGQIAGRAGRYMDDGSFSTLADTTPPIPAPVIERVEAHRFPRIRRLVWRNVALDFHSPRRLLASLAAPPPRPELVRAEDALDEICLKLLLADPEVAATLASPECLRLLWEVCGLPDYRQTTPGRHAALVRRLYLSLVARGRISEDWIARAIRRIDNVAGDIDTLAGRIAQIRIWTYLTHRADWVVDAAGWAERARAVEDRLSDALHRVLADRFVDRRTSVLMRELREKGEVSVDIDEDGTVRVDGTAIARIEGLRLRPLPSAGDPDRRLREKLAQGPVKAEIARRFKAFLALGEEVLALDAGGGGRPARILWRGAPLAVIEAGDDPLRPAVRLLPDLALDAEQARQLAERLARWLKVTLEQELAPLFALRALREAAERTGRAETGSTESPAPLTAAGRAMAFRLEESLGVVRRRDAEAELKALTPDDRAALRRAGVRFGATAVYMPALLRPAAQRLKAVLWALGHGPQAVVFLPPPGHVSITVPAGAGRELVTALGYLVFAPGRAVRIDMLERLADLLRPFGRNGAWFEVTADEMSTLGCRRAELPAVMRLLGYGHRVIEAAADEGREGEGQTAPGTPQRIAFFWEGHGPRGRRRDRRVARSRPARQDAAPDRKPQQARHRPRRKAGRRAGDDVRADSPFAVLVDLKRALAEREKAAPGGSRGKDALRPAKRRAGG